jgi:hexosaminidase
MPGHKIAVLIVLLSGTLLSHGQANRRYDPGHLRLEWDLVKNQDKDSSGFVSLIRFFNKGRTPMPKSGWKIYFNLRYHGYRLASMTNTFEIKHVGGELFYIVPSPSFKGLEGGQSVIMEYAGDGIVANYQDLPSGLFWVYKDTQAIPLKELVIPRSHVQTREPVTIPLTESGGADREATSSALNIFPTPREVHEWPGIFILDDRVSIQAADGFRNEANYLSAELRKLMVKKSSPDIAKSITNNIIILRKSPLPPEAYQLEIKPRTITISAGDGAGAFYGIQSLMSLLPIKAWKSAHANLEIPCIEVNDAPQFPCRELMLDVSRNFQPNREILKVLDLMSIYKLNVFHFHLTDDEGWRLEIPGIPELTSVGARRGFPFRENHLLQPSYGSGPNANRSVGTGYYSKKDFIEILRYASTRHIRVIPEIESPGHARAAVKSMAAHHLLDDPQDLSKYISNQGFNDNVMNVALPSTYAFMEKVIDGICAMYREAGASLSMIHVGGDEIPPGSWEASPAVTKLLKNNPSLRNMEDIRNYYFMKLNAMLKTRGISLCGWEELAGAAKLPSNSYQSSTPPISQHDSIQLDAWWSICGKEDAGYRLANAGYKVTLSCLDFFYFDLANDSAFFEPGDAWVGYLDLQKVFSFRPYDYYKCTRQDLRGNPLPDKYFASKEPLAQTAKANITGLQAAVWSENITSPGLLEYMMLPRLLAMAERAWAKEPGWALEKDSMHAEQGCRLAWSVFANTLGKKELPRLDYYHGGYHYRIPSIRATIRSGRLFMRCELPGFTIRYTTNGSNPTIKSRKYIQPLSARGIITLRVFDGRGRTGPSIQMQDSAVLKIH